MQSKVKNFPPSNPPGETNEEKGKENLLPPPDPPDYALNTKAHNYGGLLESLVLHQVNDSAEIMAIRGYRTMEKRAQKYGNYWQEPIGAK